MNDIEIQVSETEFKKMDLTDQNWTLMKTFRKQIEKCDQRFCTIENTYIKRFSEKIPLSTPSLLGIGAGAFFLVGYGALRWETVLKWFVKL